MKMKTTINELKAGDVVNWAGQNCEVIEVRASEIKVRYANSSGTAEHWLSRGAVLHWPGHPPVVAGGDPIGGPADPPCGTEAPIPGSRYCM